MDILSINQIRNKDTRSFIMGLLIVYQSMAGTSKCIGVANGLPYDIRAMQWLDDIWHNLLDLTEQINF